MGVHQASFPFEATITPVTVDDRNGTVTEGTPESVRCQVSGPGNQRLVDSNGTEFAPRLVVICKGLVAHRDARITLPSQFGLPANVPIRAYRPYANFKGNEYVTEVAV